MAANVETMFYTREKPWHGLGSMVAEAPEAREALRLAGLDWMVLQEPAYTEKNELITGYRVNVRDRDRKILGVVTDRYKVVQNEEAFAFTDRFWERESVTRLPDLCRKESGSGFWQGCPGSLLFWEKESHRIWSFPMPMTVPAL